MSTFASLAQSVNSAAWTRCQDVKLFRGTMRRSRSFMAPTCHGARSLTAWMFYACRHLHIVATRKSKTAARIYIYLVSVLWKMGAGKILNYRGTTCAVNGGAGLLEMWIGFAVTAVSRRSLGVCNNLWLWIWRFSVLLWNKQKLDWSGRSRLHQVELQQELGAKSAMEPGGGQCDLDTELSWSSASLWIMLTK